MRFDLADTFKQGTTWIRKEASDDPFCVCVWTVLPRGHMLLIRGNGTHEIRQAFLFNFDERFERLDPSEVT